MAKALRVLIADDEQEIVRLLMDVVAKLGWEPVGAYDGLEAYELFKRESFDLIISDIYMPKMSGLELLTKVKNENAKKTPVVLITGYSHFRTLIQSLKVKPDGFLQKPFDVNELVGTISKLQAS